MTEETPARPARAAPPTKRLKLPKKGELSPALLESFRRILAYAEAQAQRPSEEAEGAVHEFRKSVRRARSVVKLVRRFLRKGAYRSLNAALRDAVARTSVLRDVDVLVGHVAALPESRDLEPIRDALNRHLEARQRALRSEQTGDALADGLRRLTTLPEQMESSLPADVSKANLEAAVTGSFKRASKALAKAQVAPPGEHEALHTFRKRVKELRYQLELLGPQAALNEPLEALADLAESLGEVTDLAVLWDYVRAHALELDADPAALMELLHQRTAERLKTVLERAAPLFGASPVTFATGVLRRSGVYARPSAALTRGLDENHGCQEPQASKAEDDDPHGAPDNGGAVVR